MDTYGKCGDLKAARDIFDGLKVKTKPSISSMSMSLRTVLTEIDSVVLVNIYGINSHALEAVSLFYEHKNQCSGNNQSIWISVLTACAHGGLVQQAKQIFDEIPEEQRSVKIWNILVD